MNMETEVVRMGDVGTAIDLVDACIAERDEDRTERAILILREIFTGRYEQLRGAFYGRGERDA